MRAALFAQFGGPLAVTDIAEPDCPRDGVIVEVRACGVCRSDWHAWKGADPDVAAPHVPGHELAGMVAEVGRECRRWRIGDRVTAPFILACGTCADCLGGDPTICATQHVIGFSGYGAFAERVAVPHADFNLVRLPESLGFVEAAALGCRVTTAFRALVDRAHLGPGEWLAVHGCGGVGLSAIKIATAIGARVVAVDLSPRALELANRFGASRTVDAAAVADVGEAVRELTGGGAHVAVEAVGTTAAFHSSLASLRKRGRHIQIGMPTGRHAEPTVRLLELVYSRQLAILGTRGMPASRFPALIGMIEAGRIDLDGLVTRTIALAEAGAALAAFDGGEAAGVTVIDQF
jgi:alcohol dehydrogenase